MVERAIRLGGTCSGEHGVGLGKIDYLPLELGDGTVNLMETVKRTSELKSWFLFFSLSFACLNRSLRRKQKRVGADGLLPSLYSRPVQFDEPRESLPQHQAQAPIERKKKVTCRQLILSNINTFYYINLLFGPLRHYACYR